MSLRRRTAALVLAVAAPVLAGACGGSGGPSALAVDGAWSRPTPAGASTGVAYLTVTSPTDDRITGVSVPRTVARAAELHTSMTVGDGAMAPMPGMEHDAEGAMASMQPLAGVALPAGSAVAFEPGGRHIMLTGLVEPLLAGRSFELTLRFADAPARVVVVPVQANAP